MRIVSWNVNGIRSVLVGDVGVLDVLARLRAQGLLPSELILKTSAILCAATLAFVVLRPVRVALAR